MEFKCDCCGLCCRHIDRSSILKDYDTGNGVCKFLNTETNRCKIYAERPTICNVVEGYKKYFADKYTEEEYLKLNYDACENLKREFNS